MDKMANDAHQKALLAGALADTASLKSETALQGVATNGTAIISLQHVGNIQDSRLTALENAPKPINGADGAKGDKGIPVRLAHKCDWRKGKRWARQCRQIIKK